MTIRIDEGALLRAAPYETERAARERARQMEIAGTRGGSEAPASRIATAQEDGIDPELAVRLENLRASTPEPADLDAALEAVARVRDRILERPEGSVAAQTSFCPATVLQLLEG
ncbi:MAG: hypothetical protein JXP34_28000 [Planctomycetes bacterium]|nr:hypothetical protein [Planctomycetota bacterium]